MIRVFQQIASEARERLRFFLLGGLLVFLIAASIMWQSRSPAAKVLRILQALPDSTVAVFFSGDNLLMPDRMSSSLEKFFPSFVDRDVLMEATATLFLRLPDGSIRPIFAFGENPPKNLTAPSVRWQDMALAGDTEAIEFFVHAPRSSKNSRLSADVRRLLLNKSTHRLLLRSDILSERMSKAVPWTDASWIGLAWRTEESRVILKSVLPIAAVWPASITAQLPAMPNERLILDGIPLHFLLPEQLPPLLAALRAATGVEEHFRALQKALANERFSFGLYETDGRLLPILVSALPRDREQVTQGIHDLWIRRAELLGAQSERVQDEHGNFVRHLRPSTNVSDLVERDVNPLRERLTVPCGFVRDARAFQESCQSDKPVEGRDLVAALGTHVLVIGADESFVDALLQNLEESMQRLQDREVHVMIDIHALSQQSWFTAFRAGISPTSREILDLFRMVSFVIAPSGREVVVDGTLHVRE